MLTSLHLDEKSKEVCIKATSLAFTSHVTKHTAVKWLVNPCDCNICHLNSARTQHHLRLYSTTKLTTCSIMYAYYADLNMTVTLLRIVAVLAQIHSLIRTSYFAENASAFSRILFKDSELKKMGRMDNFIKVNSDAINPATPLTKYLT